MDAQKDAARSFLEVADARAGAQVDPVLRARGLQKRLLEVGAVKDPERSAEGSPRAGKIEPRENDAVAAATDIDRGGLEPRGRERRLESKPCEHAPGVGRDLQPRADLFEFLRALENQNASARPRERQRRGQPADAGAGDDDRRGQGPPALRSFFGRAPDAFGGVGAAVQRFVIDVMRRAIGADGLIRSAHVDIDVGVIEGRQRADAHELLRPDLHRRNAGLVVEMGRGMLGHGPLVLLRRAGAAGRFPILQRGRIEQGGAKKPPDFSGGVKECETAARQPATFSRLLRMK